MFQYETNFYYITVFISFFDIDNNFVLFYICRIESKLNFNLNGDKRMKTIIANADNISIIAASKIIKSGGLVAFPTETVYGLGANALNPMAAKKIYYAKGRPSDNPLIVHIASERDLYSVGKNINAEIKNLTKNFWPGPLTIICKKKSCIPNETSGGLDTVAVRFPANPIAQKLILSAGVPIAAPSANISGKPSCTRAKHVIKDLNGKIDMILCDDKFSFGIESTIIDMTQKNPVILRPGAITFEMLKKILPNVSIGKSLIVDNEHPKAPGMKYKHYSPEADVFIIFSDERNINARQKKIIDKVNKMVSDNQKNKLKPGVLTFDQTKEFYKNCFVLSMGDKNNLLEIANNLFDCLREFDLNQIDVVYAESIDEKEIGSAIMNRLLKSADYKIIRV